MTPPRRSTLIAFPIPPRRHFKSSAFFGLPWRLQSSPSSSGTASTSSGLHSAAMSTSGRLLASASPLHLLLLANRVWVILDFDLIMQFSIEAILSIKKGAYLLNCGRRGKPKFCPFQLSTDEKFLIWYSGQEERQLRVSSTMKIIPGQNIFPAATSTRKEPQSFSLVYANGECSLDLIYKNKEQADSWMD